MSNESDEAAVEARITKMLRALIDDQDLTEHPPAPYLRRHLAEHAAAGGRLNRQVITSQLLPWLDIARLRAIFTATQPSELRDIALLTRSVRHLWDRHRPDRNAIVLSLWAAATGTSSAAPRARWTQMAAPPQEPARYRLSARCDAAGGESWSP
jgi:hypothetical protein